MKMNFLSKKYLNQIVEEHHTEVQTVSEMIEHYSKNLMSIMLSASQFNENMLNIEKSISLILNAVKNSDESDYYANEDGCTCFDITLSGYKKKRYIVAAKAMYSHHNDSSMIPIYTNIIELLSIMWKKNIEYIYIMDGNIDKEKCIGIISHGIITMMHFQYDTTLSTELNIIKKEISIYDNTNDKFLHKNNIELLNNMD